MNINIAGLDKAHVLAALFNASKQQGMGFLHAEGRAQMTPSDAGKIIAEMQEKNATFLPTRTAICFDYLRGRVMKVDIGGNELDPRLYDCDVGEGAAAQAVESVRAQ